MNAPLSPELARALQARLEFYRELGVYDFYRRESAPVWIEEALTEAVSCRKAFSTLS